MRRILIHMGRALTYLLLQWSHLCDVSCPSLLCVFPERQLHDFCCGIKLHAVTDLLVFTQFNKRSLDECVVVTKYASNVKSIDRFSKFTPSWGEKAHEHLFAVRLGSIPYWISRVWGSLSRVAFHPHKEAAGDPSTTRTCEQLAVLVSRVSIRKSNMLANG